MSKQKLNSLTTFPERFSWLIGQLQEETGLAQKEIAQKLGVHSASLSQLKSGSSKKPSKATLLLLRQVFRANPGWLESGQGEPFLPKKSLNLEGLPEFIEIPRLQLAPSSKTELQQWEKAPLSFRKDWIEGRIQSAPEDLALVEMSGNSMEPTLSDGETLLLDRSRTYIQNDKIYAISAGGTLLIKRLRQRLDGQLQILCDHPDFEDEQLDPKSLHDFKILGQVRWRGGEL